MRLSSTRTQSGAITLMVIITLVLIAALGAFYSTQSVFIDRLAGHAQVQASQARLSAEAALAWSQAEIQRITQTTSAATFWSTTPTAPCPASHTGLQWQCVRMSVPPLPGSNADSAQVLAIRDLLNAPHVTQLQATSVLADQRSKAQVNQNLFMPTVFPAPTSASAAAVVLSSTDIQSACAPSPWSQVLGDLSADQLRAWSLAQERQGLHTLSQPPRTIYWIDSPAPWSQSLGTAQMPVLLVFSATACTPTCPAMVSGVHIHGTVVLDTQCQDARARGWRPALIDGQLVINSGWPDAPSTPQVVAQAYARKAYLLAWPQGMDARQVQGISGSWSEGTP